VPGFGGSSGSPSSSAGDGEALVDYDPTAGTSTVLLGPTVNGGGVRNALPYPGSE
jgi:TolB protein